MSYHIPGFRQSHSWFPTEIFNTTTLQKVKAYRKKYSEMAAKYEDGEPRENLERDDYDEEDEDQSAAKTRKLWTSPDEDKSASEVKDLKVQVSQLQEQVAQQVKAQQEMHEQSQGQLQEMHERSQKQLQELMELLLANNRA